MGLVVVVAGFYLYQRPVVAKEEAEAARRRSKRRGPEERPLVPTAPAPLSKAWKATAIGVQVPSFQERVVAGLGPAIHHVALSASPAILLPTTAPGTAEEDDEASEDASEDGNGRGGGHRPRPPWLGVI